MSTIRQPESDRVWSVEMNGINPIDQQERHGRPLELFWVWFAGNIGILGVVYGAQYLAGNGLNLWQSLFIGLVATAVSFIFVGILSIPGVWGGAPMLTLSRAVFGTRGNIGPTLVSWISLVGWETILVITSTYALLALLRVVGVQTNPFWTFVCILLLAVAVVVCGYWGHATLIWLQRAATWVFGILTVVIIVFLVPQTDWHKVLSQPMGPWDTGLVTAFIIVMAATGIGWINTGADYARYLPRRSSGRAITLWTTLGGTLPLYVLMIVGVLLASHKSAVLTTADPLSTIQQALPSWLSIPYLLVAIGGLLAGAALDIYSSGLNLLAMGIRMRRQYAVLIDGVLMVIGAIYVLLIRNDFQGALTSFLLLLADALTVWAAIFLIDMIWRRGYDKKSLQTMGPASSYYYTAGFNIPACIAWVVGIGVGLLFTSSAFFNGPLAKGIFVSTSLGYLLGAAVSIVLYLVLRPLFRYKQTALLEDAASA
ncbi:MAG: cytosine permease [Chloroflexota bacterium]|nr:cytosine permease [Chloroflexota bacterium]